MEKFKLFASCIPVKGAIRSTICDLQRQVVKVIPNDLFEILNKFDGKSIESIIDYYGVKYQDIIKEYFDFLLENDFIFFTDSPESYPKIDTDWEIPELVSNGIIDVNSKSSHDWAKIFNQFNDVGCKHLQLRFFEQIDIFNLTEILELTNSSILQSLEILMPYYETLDQIELKQIVMRFGRISQLILHSTPEIRISESSTKESRILYVSQRIDSNSHCGQINERYFSVNQNNFLESINRNSCLNSKISIDTDGSIKNCPSLLSIYGNVENTTLHEVLATSKLNELWKLTKDQIEICKDCEFRYICTDCRAFHDTDNSLLKPKKCNYNPYSGEWENDLG